MSLSLDEILNDVLQRVRAGEKPEINEIIKKAPHHSVSLHRLLPLLLEMEELGKQAFTPTPGLTLPLPFKLGEHYTLTRCIGYGGMGTVFEAIQHPLQRRCAVKLLSTQVKEDDPRHHAFMHEAHIIGMLHHRSIVKIYAADRQHDYSYYAMEYIDGQGLDTTPITSYTMVAKIGLQIAEALCYAHQCHVTHCDVKPSNILLDQSGNAHLGDFGLARMLLTHAFSPNETPPTRLGGTLRYMAPECQAQHAFTPLSDQYAFGLTLYELMIAAANHSLPSPHHNPTRTAQGLLAPQPGPKDLLAILQKCTALRPTERYMTMEDLVADLQRFLHGLPVNARKRNIFIHLALWSKRQPLAAMLAGAMLLSVVLFLFLLLRDVANTHRSLLLADKTLAHIVDYVAKAPPSSANTHLLQTLLPYYQQFSQLQGLPLEHAQQAESVIALNAYLTGDYLLAERILSKQWQTAPTPTIGHTLIDTLTALGKTDAAKATAHTLIQRYIRDAAPQTSLYVAQALLKLDTYHHQPAAELAFKRLLTLATDHPTNTDITLTLLLLLDQHPHLLARVPASLPLPPLQYLNHYLSQLAHQHPNNLRYTTRFLEKITASLTAASTPSSLDLPLLEQALRCCEHALHTWHQNPALLQTCVLFWTAYMRDHRKRTLWTPPPPEAIAVFKQLDRLYPTPAFGEQNRARFINDLFEELSHAPHTTDRPNILHHLLKTKLEGYHGEERPHFQRLYRQLRPLPLYLRPNTPPRKTPPSTSPSGA